MNLITQTFYVLSSALLIPMMLALLWALFRVLMLVGQVLQEYMERARLNPLRQSLQKCLLDSSPRWPEVVGTSVFAGTLKSLMQSQSDESRMAFSISRADLEWQKRLETLRAYIRNGPALGLMGTLIPLGPALVGLAVGDIQTMSTNLVIAFSTTVIGLLVGMIAATLTSIRRSWYLADAALLTFAAERLCSLTEPISVIPTSTSTLNQTAINQTTLSQAPLSQAAGESLA